MSTTIYCQNTSCSISSFNFTNDDGNFATRPHKEILQPQKSCKIFNSQLIFTAIGTWLLYTGCLHIAVESNNSNFVCPYSLHMQMSG